jgi:predicted nucleic-acid-binding protein
VLRRVYKLDKHTVTAILDKLFTRAELAIEGRETVQQALGSYIASSADFADCLIASFDAAAGVEQTYTFDEAASEVAEFKLLECKP